MLKDLPSHTVIPLFFPALNHTLPGIPAGWGVFMKQHGRETQALYMAPSNVFVCLVVRSSETLCSICLSFLTGLYICHHFATLRLLSSNFIRE